jgi:hypothetical protein
VRGAGPDYRKSVNENDSSPRMGPLQPARQTHAKARLGGNKTEYERLLVELLELK